MKNTQTKEILKYMQTHKKGITQKIAWDNFGASRLSGIIFALKKKGYNITMMRESVPTRYGRSVSVARYVLES